MPFEETLRRSLEALARELASAVETERADAAAIARQAAEQDAAAVAQAAASAEERGRAEGHEQGRAEGHGEGYQQGRAQGHAAGYEQGRAEGHREGDEQGRAEGYAEGRAQGVAEGRAETREAAQPAVATVDLAVSQRLADAIRAIDRARSLSEILDTLTSCAGRETARVAVLLVSGAQLRGWRFLGFGAAVDGMQRFEMAVDQSGIIAEAVRTAAPVSTDGAAAASPPPFALPPGRESLAMPVSLSGQVVAVLYGDQGTGDRGDRDVRFAWPATLEVMARHAARCLEAVTTFRAAQVLTANDTSIGAGANAGFNSLTHPFLNSPTSEDEQSARRYARLLISEIKLYHERDVIAGRRERDLGMRLGGEIARARGLYEQRIPAHIRGAADYFHDELVRTLADGDQTLLELKS